MMLSILLNSDVLGKILEFCAAEDLISVTSSSYTLLTFPHNNILWKNLCLSRWDMRDDTVPKHLEGKVKFAQLHATAWPLCRTLVSNDDDVECHENKVVFNGLVALGYRSVQSSVSFPKVKERETCWTTNSIIRIFYELLGYRQENKNKICFSIPFKDSMPSTVYLAPRSVMYYEVTITQNKNITQTISSELLNDCVAVGLATHGFIRQKRLPGWDCSSFGYHGDDGAIFHGQGRSLATYGPRFGVGDTVGCGIDYAAGSIFFTLNGNNLGEAFSNVCGTQYLYPTVGVDAIISLEFNFGRTEFQFPLGTYLREMGGCG